MDQEEGKTSGQVASLLILPNTRRRARGRPHPPPMPGVWKSIPNRAKGNGNFLNEEPGKQYRNFEIILRFEAITLLSISGSALFCWRPRRDLNPRYRRERAMS